VTTEARERGRLKIFLGYAAGVGKTYQMLSEARELKERGVDIAVAYFEPHGRQDTMALIEGLEVIPRRVVEYKGSPFEEMDTDAILRRHPKIAVVDEFPHTNVPGSAREKRWQDVHVLLHAGIDVITTMNVQHVESLNDQIWQSTGVRVRETIPDWVVKQADGSSWSTSRPALCSTGCNAAWCTRRTALERHSRISSGNPHWSRFASWRCARPRTQWRVGTMPRM
jgi:two-component system sensor histidine kinase KdpD